MNLIVIVLCGLMLWRSWLGEVHDAQRQTDATAELLERGTSASFDKVRIAMGNVASQIERQLAGTGLDVGAFWSVVDKAAAEVPEVLRFGVFDADGHQVCGIPADRCQHYDIGDRLYFSHLRAKPDSPVTLVGPLPSRVDNEPSMLMVRALSTPTRPFAGVIVAVLPLSRLQPLVDAARLGAHGAASMRTMTMQALTRSSPLPPAQESLATKVSDQLLENLARSPQSGVYRAVTPSDGIERVVAYRKLPAYPIYVLVGEATEDFLLGWWQTFSLACGAILLFLVAAGAIERIARASLKQQERAQQLYDEAPCGYHTLDAEGRYLSINATELRWLGCDRGDVVGKLRPSDFFTDEGHATFARNFPILKQSGRLDEVELDIIGRQGDVRRVLVSAKSVSDMQGRFVLCNSVMYDITALSAARQELVARAAEQQAMLDSELVGMLRVRAGTIVWKNRGMDRIFGYAGEEWAGMPVARLYVDEDAHRQVADRIDALSLTDRHFRQQLELLRKDGSSVWVDASAVVFKTTAVGAESFTIVKDISEQRKAEAMRLRAVELEAHNVSLQEAGRLKDEFLSNMSHELRTPLNAVIGFSQLLQMSNVGSDSPHHTNYIHQIGESGMHLLSLVQTMLDIAETASGKMSFVPQLLTVRSALDEVAQMLEPKRLAAQVELVVNVDPDIDTVVNDPLRLRQMVLNLAGNAVKFSRPGGSVWMRASGLDEMRWCIEVEDQGIGIGADDLDRLFSTFVQLSEGSAKAYEGTGIGLALVRKIALAQGGDVLVRSELGVGSLFTLVLPRVLAAAPSAPTSEPVAA